MDNHSLISNPCAAASAVVQVLKQANIDTVFGIAGGHAGHIWSALEEFQDSIRTILVREESLASVMAEVYGRLTGKPGVIIGQGPWVLGNGLLGTIEAKLSSSPMLLLTDFSDTPNLSLHAPYQSGCGDYGSWDARMAFSAVTKQVFEAHHPAAAVHATQLAIKHALAGQPGPVAVIYSQAAISGTVSPREQPYLYNTQAYIPTNSKAIDNEAVKAASNTLKQAKRPIIIAGNGVRINQAFTELYNLANTLNIPVVTSPSGKGVFPENNALSLGLYGTYGSPAANAAVHTADVILAIGTKLSASDTAYETRALIDPTRQKIIQVDIEPKNAAWSYPATHTIISQANIALDQLTIASESYDGNGLARNKKLRKHYPCHLSKKTRDESLPMLPQRLIAELQRTLPEDAIVTSDAGENRIFMMRFYQSLQPNGFLQAAGAGPMGYAIPAAMGAKLLNMHRPVIAVCGDGGFAMSMNGLMTAIEAQLPIIVVIFNNQMLGWSTHIRGPFGAQFANFDHAAIARSLGCNGSSADTPDEFSTALREALLSELPTVIDVKVSDSISYKDLTAQFDG